MPFQEDGGVGHTPLFLVGDAMGTIAWDRSHGSCQQLPSLQTKC